MDLKERVERCLGSDALSVTEYRGDITVEVPRRRIITVLKKLKEAADLEFDFLTDLFGVDNLDLYKKKKKKKGDEEEAEKGAQEPQPPRFEVNYLLQSLKSNERLRVKIQVPEDDLEVESATVLWKAADWPERECFDMFGIRFKGHYNLKRLLMWDEFPDHPLRKDYPLEGKGEERHFPVCEF